MAKDGVRLCMAEARIPSLPTDLDIGLICLFSVNDNVAGHSPFSD
jgi:hypothetical protein